VGGAGRAPRRYRGRDVVAWLYEIGFFDLTPDKLPVPREKFAAPHVSGARGGHTLNLHQFARDGVTLLGHFRGASGNTISLAPDLHETLARADNFEKEVQKMVDGFILTTGLGVPEEELPQLRDGYNQPVIETLDLAKAGVSTVIWAIGYTHDYSLVQLPVVDASGFPIQERGVTSYPGLYFVGMPWMPSLKSGILPGVGEFAGDVTAHILQGARVPQE
jgi:putative flavoprotein involved in K+ transport